VNSRKTDLSERLKQEYENLNREVFDGELDGYLVRWRKSSIHTHGSINLSRKVINVSLPLYEQFGWDAVTQTLIHELTHALIYQKGGQTRHTKRFWAEFEDRGGIREKYIVKPNTVYIYACCTCGSEIPRIRKLKKPFLYSCMKCDKNYNPKHRLYLQRDKCQKSLEEY